MKNTYKIDFSNNTLTMTKAFEAAANEYGSEEYKLLQKIRADFPGIEIIRKTRRPSKTARPNKNLTYTTPIMPQNRRFCSRSTVIQEVTNTASPSTLTRMLRSSQM